MYRGFLEAYGPERDPVDPKLPNDSASKKAPEIETKSKTAVISCLLIPPHGKHRVFNVTAVLHVKNRAKCCFGSENQLHSSSGAFQLFFYL